MSRPTPTAIGYFGKIPSRGDFVKSGDNPALLKMLDDWLANAMDLMSADARWKLTYDALAPLHFAFIGPRRGRAIAGHIAASSDASSRRFPFLMMSAMEVGNPAGFVPTSPLVLSRLWNRLDALSGGLRGAEAAAALQAAASASIELDLRSSAYDAAFDDFLDLQTVGALDALLAPTGFGGSVRQVLLALGMLLQPVMASSSSRLEKSLELPLPDDPLYRNLVAAFWMHLIAPFLARADFELALFLTRIRGRHALVLGFCGASAQTLHAIMEPQAALEHHIAFDDLAWVEEHVGADYAIKKVSTYLAQANLSLKSAHDSFRAAFIGT
ncbi:type VI secretion system-associated protein TagF [Janthinobacterium sp. 1_2014MBL_MicDiv]|uniref:type VI secretion system-associated protein TagF n=1 Tax=Janthinobacterium sp. 1_2014MBL_MicDiv TaxID=1644131 RepID=UPI0008F540E8|nr:type VI secretion system-associated protein TagF [Janthinobacterium sp. 1_2014MBL_MicDiv]APA69164.1 type VI secretion protein [Janthinobacterium sp. 1_2014MBL_MicDiv]